MNRQPPDVFNYRLAACSHNRLPGVHIGSGTGEDGPFHRHLPLIASRDPKHLDLRACVLDVFGGYPVRSFRPQRVLDVVLVADLSASMAGQRPLLLDLLASAAASVAALGDRFRFLACDSQGWLPELSQAPSASCHLDIIVERLSGHRFRAGIPLWPTLSPVLPTGRALVLLLTDGHFPMAVWQSMLKVFTGHALLPLLAWRAEEYQQLPDWGLMSLQESETGHIRTVLMRPSYKRAIIGSYQRQQRQLVRLCRHYGAEPVFLETPYRSHQLQHHFLARPL